MNYAIIGCGLIGRKRLAGLPAGSKLVVACDTNLSRAEELVKLAGTGRPVFDFKKLFPIRKWTPSLSRRLIPNSRKFPPPRFALANTLSSKNRQAFP
jgi:hypothetical protein